MSLKLILNAIAIPMGLIASLTILFRNKRNFANILISSAAFLGGVLAIIFALVREIFYDSNLLLALTFTKIEIIIIFSVTIPVLSFSLFFWNCIPFLCMQRRVS